jgi:enoyl-CoA hydratase
MSDKILLQIQPDAPVAMLTFNRPERRNALDLESMRQFATIVEALKAAPLSALIVTGAGTRAFCSGGDLADLAQLRAADDANRMSALMSDALLTLENLPYPVIAAINGYALGGGSEVALACDLRVLDQTARLGLVQARRGLTPGWGAGQRLLRLVGYSRALNLLLSAKMIAADEALSLGLANVVTEAGQALAAAREMAYQIASLDRTVVRAIKALLRDGLSLTSIDAQRAEQAHFAPLWEGATHQRSLDDFLAGKQA